MNANPASLNTIETISPPPLRRLAIRPATACTPNSMKTPGYHLLSRLARLAAISLAGTAVQLAAATYYVSTTGNDGNNGSSGAPFATIQHAVDQTVLGDIIKIRTGTYVEKLLIDTPNIEVMPDGTASVTISGSGIYLAPYTPLVSVTGDGVTLRDLTVTTASERGIQVTSQNALLDGLTVNECGDRAISLNSATNVTVQYCDISHSGLKNPPSSWPSTLGIVDSTNCNVIGNVVHQTYGEAINDLRSSGTLIEGNVVWDFFSCGIYLDNSRDSIVRYNIVYATSDTTYWRTASKPSPGMGINNEPYPKGNPDPSFYCRDMMIYNNFVYNTGSLFSFWVASSTPNSTFTNITVANNTFVSELTGTVGAAASGVTVSTLGTRTNCVFKNNIVQKNVGPISPGTPAPGLTFSYNNWSVAPDPDFSGTGDVVANAQLQLGTGTPNENWIKLAGISPCIGAAQVVTGITDDFFGTARGSDPDIGAYEYVSGNLLANPGFESDLATGWSQGTATGSLVRVMNNAHAGSYSLKATGAGAFAERVQTKAVTAGQTYTISGWIKVVSTSGGNGFSIRYQWLNSSGGSLGQGWMNQQSATSGYVKKTFTGSAPTGAVNLKVSCAIRSATGTAYFDDISVTSP